METFSALLAICAGNSPVPGEFPAQRPVTRSFDVFFHLRLNKRLSKQSWGWWYETLSRPLWRHRNVIVQIWRDTRIAAPASATGWYAILKIYQTNLINFKIIIWYVAVGYWTLRMPRYIYDISFWKWDLINGRTFDIFIDTDSQNRHLA